MISLYVNSSNLTALGFVLGSESYTPSANFFAIRIASASISAARNAAVVSVEKYGLPRPAPKITIRFFPLSDEWHDDEYKVLQFLAFQ